MFLGLKNLSQGSLFYIPLHRLERLRFSATPGNTFFPFFGLTNILMGSLHRLEMISFLAAPGNTFLCFLGLKIFFRVLCFPYLCTDCSSLDFQQHLATSVAMATLFYVS